MSQLAHSPFAQAAETIDQAILPNLSRLLDSVIESASLARPGIDAAAYSAGVRDTARQVSQLTRLIAAVYQPAAAPSISA
ncbi:MAG TPA: hypothetical protein VEW04_03025 [Allosphingosinicella sp.]|jgi:hypothetical protein|nr:hypothetical protein [Allosphingosinicella sp.]